MCPSHYFISWRKLTTKIRLVKLFDWRYTVLFECQTFEDAIERTDQNKRLNLIREGGDFQMVSKVCAATKQIWHAVTVDNSRGKVFFLISLELSADFHQAKVDIFARVGQENCITFLPSCSPWPSPCWEAGSLLSLSTPPHPWACLLTSSLCCVLLSADWCHT